MLHICRYRLGKRLLTQDTADLAFLCTKASAELNLVRRPDQVDLPLQGARYVVLLQRWCRVGSRIEQDAHSSGMGEWPQAPPPAGYPEGWSAEAAPARPPSGACLVQQATTCLVANSGDLTCVLQRHSQTGR